MYTTCSNHGIFVWFNGQSIVLLWVSWCKNKSFWQRIICTKNKFPTYVFLKKRTKKIWIFVFLQKVRPNSKQPPDNFLGPNKRCRFWDEIVYDSMEGRISNYYRVQWTYSIKKKTRSTNSQFWDFIAYGRLQNGVTELDDSLLSLSVWA